jgi:hypothetical protein
MCKYLKHEDGDCMGAGAFGWGLARTYGVGVYRGKNPVYCAHVHDRPSMPLGFRQPSGKRSERPV